MNESSISTRASSNWRRAFRVGLFLKALNGLWETIVGAYLLIGRGVLPEYVTGLARSELLKYPHDRIIDVLMHSLLRTAEHSMKLVAIYILVHGLLNIFLVVQLRRDRHWAYPVTIAIMSLLGVYQLYRISLYHSPLLVIATTLDVIFIVLAWHEYRRHQESVNM